MSTGHEARLAAIRAWKPDADYVRRFQEWLAEYDRYMEQPAHTGNCHCARCMSEFVSASAIEAAAAGETPNGGTNG